jgi:hypothetical protein
METRWGCGSRAATLGRFLLAMATLLVANGSGFLVGQPAAFAARLPSVEARSSGPSVAPKKPEGLAAGPDGRLYIVRHG